MSKKWISTLLILVGLLLFISGWGLAYLLAPKPSIPSTATILEGHEWFEEDITTDAGRHYFFHKGKMQFDYFDIDSNEERFTVAYTKSENGNLLFDRKAVKTFQQSEYFYVEEEVATMELALVHSDSYPSDSVYSPVIVWKKYDKEGILIHTHGIDYWLP